MGNELQFTLLHETAFYLRFLSLFLNYISSWDRLVVHFLTFISPTMAGRDVLLLSLLVITLSVVAFAVSSLNLISRL